MATKPKRARKLREKQRRANGFHQQQKGPGLSVLNGEPAPTVEHIALASRFFMEKTMVGMFGDSRTEEQRQAQEVAFQAMEAEEAESAVELAFEALRLDPFCLDALCIIAALGTRDRREHIQCLHGIVAKGEEVLGRQIFEEDRGQFWGILETRPYMRARAELAQLLVQEGRFSEAISHYETMLELNPNDNQGLRDPLLSCYLRVGDSAGARRLFEQ